MDNDLFNSEELEKLNQAREQFLAVFGRVAIAFLSSPRYRDLSISDLSYYLLEPLIRDRVAIISDKPNSIIKNNALSGIAIWANVSDEVDQAIREQINRGEFPIRLNAMDWTSGDITWILELIAPTRELQKAVLFSFGQDENNKNINIHPIVARLVEPDILRSVGIDI